MTPLKEEVKLEHNSSRLTQLESKTNTKTREESQREVKSLARVPVVCTCDQGAPRCFAERGRVAGSTRPRCAPRAPGRLEARARVPWARDLQDREGR